MRTFLISDTHFFHKNIIKYCNRPFANIEEMNEALIKNWNNTVKDEDLIIHLGDIGLGNKTQIAEVISKLKGRKWLIMGNHDNLKRKDYEEMGFEFVSENPIIFKEFYFLSHKPMYMNENMPYVNIYGHVHDNPMYKDRTENTWCISVERTNYAPVLLEDFEIKFEVETMETAQKKRKLMYGEKLESLGKYRDKEMTIFLTGGRIFVELEISNDNVFRQEYSSSKTDFDEIVLKIKEIFNDPQHPFVVRFLEKSNAQFANLTSKQI